MNSVVRFFAKRRIEMNAVVRFFGDMVDTKEIEQVSKWENGISVYYKSGRSDEFVFDSEEDTERVFDAIHRSKETGSCEWVK